jgi:hypothetical protein
LFCNRRQADGQIEHAHKESTEQNVAWFMAVRQKAYEIKSKQPGLWALVEQQAASSHSQREKDQDNNNSKCALSFSRSRSTLFM